MFRMKLQWMAIARIVARSCAAYKRYMEGSSLKQCLQGASQGVDLATDNSRMDGGGRAASPCVCLTKRKCENRAPMS